jgi:hypothetical protein
MKSVCPEWTEMSIIVHKSLRLGNCSFLMISSQWLERSVVWTTFMETTKPGADIYKSVSPHTWVDLYSYRAKRDPGTTSPPICGLEILPGYPPFTDAKGGEVREEEWPQVTGEWHRPIYSSLQNIQSMHKSDRLSAMRAEHHVWDQSFQMTVFPNQKGFSLPIYFLS